MKDSYRIGNILKKLTGLKFRGSQKDPDVSEKAKQYAVSSSYKKQSSTKTSEGSGKKSNRGKKNEYIQYQKEYEASKLLGTESEIKKPGRILKLPVNRKELMDLFED